MSEQFDYIIDSASAGGMQAAGGSHNRLMVDMPALVPLDA